MAIVLQTNGFTAALAWTLILTIAGMAATAQVANPQGHRSKLRVTVSVVVRPG